MKRDLNIRLEPSRAKGPWQPEPMPAIYSQSIPPLYFWLGADAYPEWKIADHITAESRWSANFSAHDLAILAARSVP